LKSVQDYASEIIIVDTGSTDKTIEICKAMGAVVIPYQWKDDFSQARNTGLLMQKGNGF
jgi:glycosyltransferase involved in cell wall biosynthesis